MRRINPTMVVAVVALVFACSGGAYAASSYITGKQVKNSSLTGADIKDKSLTPADFQGSVKGPAGPAGPAGVAGPQGPQGPAGAPGPSSIQQISRVTASMSVAAGQVDGPTVACPPGQGIVSGGFQSAGAGYVFTSDSFGVRSWSVGYDNFDATVAADVTAIAFCAPAGSAITPKSAGTSFADAVAAQQATHDR